MRLSLQLCKQHIGWHLKKLWATQSARTIEDTGAKKNLLEQGISVLNSEDILRPPIKRTQLDIVGYKTKRVALDNTHPNWHDRTLLTYKNENVLLEGLTQAKILTNTVEIQEGLPELNFSGTKISNKRVKEIILSCHVFDAQQVKLPVVKDPNRPAWNFPRTYGITQSRIIDLLLQNLLQLIENESSFDVVKERHLVENTNFSYNFEKFGDLIQFDFKGDSLLTTLMPLKPITYTETKSVDLGSIAPIKPTITLVPEQIYELKNVHSLGLNFEKSYPHTIFVPQVDSEIQNLYGEPVTETQIYGRSLLKTFTVAASFAKQKFGKNVATLPNPVTVQCVQTNGKFFHFGILQLNTLDLEGSDVKNIWYQTERIPLFDECCYKVGRPVLEGYNKEVIKYLAAFYNNN